MKTTFEPIEAGSGALVMLFSLLYREFSVIKTKTLFWWIYRDTHFLLKEMQLPVVSRLNSISLTPMRGEASLLKSKQI